MTDIQAEAEALTQELMGKVEAVQKNHNAGMAAEDTDTTFIQHLERDVLETLTQYFHNKFGDLDKLDYDLQKGYIQHVARGTDQQAQEILGVLSNMKSLPISTTLEMYIKPSIQDVRLMVLI